MSTHNPTWNMRAHIPVLTLAPEWAHCVLSIRARSKYTKRERRGLVLVARAVRTLLSATRVMRACVLFSRKKHTAPIRV